MPLNLKNIAGVMRYNEISFRIFSRRVKGIALATVDRVNQPVNDRIPVNDH